MTSNAASVAIAGAGIGGLSTAIALSRAGVRAEVFERRPQLSEVGAGIQLGPNATKVLHGLGVLDAVRAASSEPDGLTIHDGMSGRVLGRFPLGKWIANHHGAPYLTLHRQDLHSALFDAAQAAGLSIQHGREVAGFVEVEDGVEVNFSEGARERHRALIAADGLWSRLRSRVAECGSPFPLGKCAYRAVVAPDALAAGLAPNDVHIWLAPHAHAVHYPVRRGREIAVVVVIDGAAPEESWALQASRSVLLGSAAGHFAEALLNLIYATEDWRMWPLQRLAPLKRWTKGAVALLGDAAHPIAPFLAQGGALAIEDAAVLAAILAKSNSVPVAEKLKIYEKVRRPRVDRVVAASRRNGEIYHARGLVASARNAVLSAIPGMAMMRRYDWLYGWAM